MLSNVPWTLDVLALYIITFLNIGFVNIGFVLQLMRTPKALLHTRERSELWSWWCSLQFLREYSELSEFHLCGPGVVSLFRAAALSASPLVPSRSLSQAVAVFARRWGVCREGVRCGWPLRCFYFNCNSISADGVVEHKIKASAVSKQPPNHRGLP